MASQCLTTCPLRRPSEFLPHNPIPPHHEASDEHGGGNESGERPCEFCGLVAEAGAAAGQSYAVRPSEMQVSKPVDHLVHSADTGVSFRGRLDPIREIL